MRLFDLPFSPDKYEGLGMQAVQVFLVIHDLELKAVIVEKFQHQIVSRPGWNLRRVGLVPCLVPAHPAHGKFGIQWIEKKACVGALDQQSSL